MSSQPRNCECGIYLCPHLGKGAYLVSGGLAESVVCCQVLRIPHASLVASLLEQRKENTYMHGRAWSNLYTECGEPSGNGFGNGLAS